LPSVDEILTDGVAQTEAPPTGEHHPTKQKRLSLVLKWRGGILFFYLFPFKLLIDQKTYLFGGMFPSSEQPT
jgi:hypothetical protein